MAFVQTAEMLELFRRNFKSGILIMFIENKENPNKYNMHQLLITGIDQDIGNVLTFGLGFLSQKNKY